MSQINIIAICPEDAAEGVSAMLEAMGKGPGSMERKLTTVDNPAWDAAPTHRMMSNQGVTTEFQAQLLAAQGGDLPPVQEGVVWGVDGVISAPDAMAASAQLFVVSFAGDATGEQQVQAAIAAHNPVLHIIPFPEI